MFLKDQVRADVMHLTFELSHMRYIICIIQKCKHLWLVNRVSSNPRAYTLLSP